MPFISKSKTLHWTFHARDKMRFYRLSEARVRRVLHSPKRVEEGVAPKTTAMMQPVSVKRVRSGESGRGQETWNQEIWVMVEDEKEQRKIISAWRYPGMTRPKDEAVLSSLREAYREYANDKTTD